MSINNRIIEFIAYLEISELKFITKTGLSNGAFRGKSLGTDKLAKIKRIYSNLNLNWVLFGEGDMIIDANTVMESGVVYEKTTTIDQIIQGKIDKRIEALADNVDKRFKVLENKI